MQSFYTTRVLQKRSKITAFDHIRKSLFRSVFKSGELEIMDILIGVEVFCPINPLPSDDQVFKNQIPDGTSWSMCQQNGVGRFGHLGNPTGRQVHREYLGRQWLYFGKWSPPDPLDLNGVSVISSKSLKIITTITTIIITRFSAMFIRCGPRFTAFHQQEEVLQGWSRVLHMDVPGDSNHQDDGDDDDQNIEDLTPEDLW